MNSKPRISVILSVYNGQSYLRAALQSIVDQTFTDFELIIIDDCSTDRSVEIIELFREHDSRITLLHNNAKIGLTKSLNIGLSRATGAYIARIDADDICHPNRFEQQLVYLERHPEVFLCATEFDYIDTKNNIIERNVFTKLTSDQIKTNLGRKNCLLHPTIMFLNDGSRFRDNFYYAQDYDFYLMALTQKKRLALLPDKLVQYRWNPLAISTKQRSKQSAFAKMALKFYQQRRLRGNDEYDTFEPSEILSYPDENNSREKQQVELMAFYLQNDQPERARQVLQSYRGTNGKTLITQVILSLFITFPLIYRFYRRFRYHE